MGLGRFDEAKECYESLQFLNEKELADRLLKKIHDTEGRNSSPERLTNLCQSAQKLSL